MTKEAAIYQNAIKLAEINYKAALLRAKVARKKEYIRAANVFSKTSLTEDNQYRFDNGLPILNIEGQ